MFEVITDRTISWDYELSTSVRLGASFLKNTEEGNTPVHRRLEDDDRESCAEYNRRVVETVASKQNWCSSCTEMIIHKMVVEGCERCLRSQRRRHWDKEQDSYILNNPDWFSVEEDEIQQLLNSPTSFGEDELSPWPIYDCSFRPGLTRLGLSADCPICPGIGTAILSKRPVSSDGALKVRQLILLWQKIDWDETVGCRDSAVISMKVEWEMPEANSEINRFEFRLFPIGDVDGPQLLYYGLNRLNPMVLKHHIQSQFAKYPQDHLRQTADYPRSFRLIDVNKRCVVNMGNTHVRYSAISHRWDQEDKNMLTPDTQDLFAQPGSLSPNTMSRTLYECMAMAQFLEIPYIWIDRYCIMQDDAKEKAEQIRAIGDIYSNSYLTMMCALSKDIHHGIPGYSRDFDGKFKAMEPWGCCGTSEHIPYMRQINSDWQTRGWTMQEEHLSARRLYFTDWTIMWNINCPTVPYHHADVTEGSACRRSCVEWQETSLFDLMKEYSCRDLTVPEDRLNAISGLLNSRAVEHAFGIPTRNIQYALSWFPCEDQLGSPAYQFPTWSWAHLFRAVFWFHKPPTINSNGVKFIHRQSAPRKIVSSLRKIGLPLSALDELSDGQLLIRARVRRIRTTDDFVMDITGRRSQPPLTCLLLEMCVYSRDTIFSIAIEPLTPQGSYKYGNVIHAIRIGSTMRRYKDRKQTYQLHNFRPMAIQTLTTLKRQRIGGLRLQQDGSRKWTRRLVSNQDNHHSRSSESVSSARSERSGTTQGVVPLSSLHCCEPEIPPSRDRKPKNNTPFKRKPSTNLQGTELKTKCQRCCIRLATGVTNNRQHERLVRREKRKKPVHRRSFGCNPFKDNASSFTTIILH